MKKFVGCWLVFSMGLTIWSCNRLTPAGFWKNFKPNLLAKSIGDQGPYGGHLAIDWKAGNGSAFIAGEIIRYATLNGWQLVDSFDYQPRDRANWFYDSKPIFPLSSAGFSPNPSPNADFRYFPRWINASVKVYTFKTGWVVIEPGSGKSVDENGFLLLNKAGTEMSVYHLWGE